MNNKKIKILHIINNLSPGGAEIMLLNLVSHADRSRFDISVFSLQDKGDISIDIEKLGIPIFHFNILKKYDFFLKFLKLIFILIKIKPDIVHTWMYHSNLIGGIAAKFASRSKIIWSIHSTTLAPGPEKKSTEIVIRLSSFFSKYLPDKIVLCSKSSYEFHKIIGFEKNKMMVIPNGIDLGKFKYSSKAKLNLMSKLKLAHDIKFIGMVGRYHPMKRHDIFLHAAQIIVNKYPFIHFILCGSGVDNSNRKLTKLIHSFSLGSNIHLFGYIADMSILYASLDILTITSSYGESFPLTLCEAMACNIPVVSTDVGDASYIINSKDMIIPINEPMLIAEKWEKIISLDIKSRNEIGVKNRSRIENLFDIKSIKKKYEHHYDQLLNFT